MKELETIQTKEKLNDVFAVDEPGPGGAHHLYVVCKAGAGQIDEKGQFKVDRNDMYACLQFQCGARKEVHAIHGICGADLLEIVRDQLTDFQAGPFPSEESAKALEHVTEALKCLNKRVEDRISRGVLGQEKK